MKTFKRYYASCLTLLQRKFIYLIPQNRLYLF